MTYGVADYWAFVVAVIVFLAIPGVGNLAIITSTGKGRIAGGLAATLGVIVGDQVLMWLAVAGGWLSSSSISCSAERQVNTAVTSQTTATAAVVRMVKAGPSAPSTASAASRSGCPPAWW